MEWLKARQARHAHAIPTPPEPELEVASEGEAEAGSARIEDMPVVPTPVSPAEPPSRQGQILAALTAAGPQGLRPAEVRQATGLPQGTVARALHGLVTNGVSL